MTDRCHDSKCEVTLPPKGLPAVVAVVTSKQHLTEVSIRGRPYAGWDTHSNRLVLAIVITRCNITIVRASAAIWQSVGVLDSCIMQPTIPGTTERAVSNEFYGCVGCLLIINDSNHNILTYILVVTTTSNIRCKQAIASPVTSCDGT